jgi:glycerol uptake facilitator-like aquaporin
MQFKQKLLAEALGTGFLLAAVIGSGIMAERLAGGNVALALLANALATGAALLVLILTFGPISGAHFNPVVSCAAWLNRELTLPQTLAYSSVQFTAALAGVAVAHLMFDLPTFFASTQARSGSAQWFSEFVATFGLVLFIRLGVGLKLPAMPQIVAAYIVAAYWFTASTSFANPAVTLARGFSNSFAGIRPSDVPGFIAAQLVGAASAVIVARLLLKNRSGG